jgi:hypothetical protein
MHSQRPALRSENESHPVAGGFFFGLMPLQLVASDPERHSCEGSNPFFSNG